MPRSPKHYCHHLQDNKLEKDSVLFHPPSWIIHILLALHTWWYFPLHNSLKRVRSCVVGKPTTRVRLPTMTTVIPQRITVPPWYNDTCESSVCLQHYLFVRSALRCHYCRVLCLVLDEPPPPHHPPNQQCVSVHIFVTFCPVCSACR